MADARDPYPPIGDYALIGDCHAAGLVSRWGSLDWCCLPRLDSGSAFGRLLDWQRGGYCSVAPVRRRGWKPTREYIGGSLVLATTFTGPAGEARVIDCLLMDESKARRRQRQLLRVIEGLRGAVELEVTVAPRFDYASVRPWIRRHGQQLYSAIGGNDGLIVWCDAELEEAPDHGLVGRVSVGPGDRVRLSLRYSPPEQIDSEGPVEEDPGRLDRRLDQTIATWRRWSSQVRLDSRDGPAVCRSALALKALTYSPTGAIAAAPTASLPEVIGGPRNWDYRYAWVRDSSFSSRAFAELGCYAEADAFRAFIMRSAAGHADDLQVMFGVGGERRLREEAVDELEGYRSSTPVRVGNGAAHQRQLDAYGELLNLTWRWHRRGHSPDDDDWRFVASLIDRAAARWSQPDHGLWEWPGEPEHFVHSKVLCWAALDRGLRLADECMRRAPVRQWKQARDRLRRAIERRGYDRKRGVFVQSFDRPELDAALLLLPTVEFVDWDDDRMLRTTAAIREELDAGEGLLYRYKRKDGLPGREGAFLCCSFWLAEALARGGDPVQGREVFDRAVACGNDLGLFSEQLDPASGELLGNFPQGLTHLAHIDAAVALAETEREG
jgi:GH15 family glucan-1,4-alpha-glucosidase